MKTCIWCRLNEDKTPFQTKAHTIPKSLGGRHICDNVCDGCNTFFGRRSNMDPSVDGTIKETFNISRYRFLEATKDVGKGRAMSRFKSEYFDIDLKKHKVTLKLKYRLHAGYQERIGLQLKKGLFKMFLEELERQKGEALNEQYNFIREFARFGLTEYPVIYFERTHGIIAAITKWMENPELFLDEQYQFAYLVREPSFFEFEFLGHVFAIPTSRYWELTFDSYIKKSMEAKAGFFKSWRPVKNFNDIDLSLSVLDNRIGSIKAGGVILPTRPKSL